jgi:iron complex outermembrane receptor protein
MSGTGCFSGRSQGPAVITGYVYDDATGEGIPGAEVVLVPSEMTVKTGPDGSFRFDNLTRGSYSIRVSVSGYSNAGATAVEASPGKVKWVKLFLKRPPQAGGS